MAAPGIVGTATSGRIGFGTYVCTPPAGAAHYLAFASTNSLTNLVPPPGWTLVASENGTLTGDRWALYAAAAADSPGDTWERAGGSTTGVQAVLVVGYDAPVTFDTPAQAGTATSPATTATGEGVVVRLMTRLPSANSDPTYPTSATLGRDVSRIWQTSGNAVEVAVAHAAVPSAGAVASAAWTAPAAGSGTVTSMTVMAYGVAPPPYETIPGASTASLTGPAARWVKGTMRPVWSDGSTWSGILPTPTGHRLYADLTAPASGAVVDNRQAARVTAVHHGGSTFVLHAHASSSLFSTFDAAWSPLVNGAAFPLTAADLDASPIVLHRSPNGHLWAAVAESGAIKVARSTDGGASWTAATTVVGSLTDTAVVGFAQSGGTVVLVANGNTGIGRWVRTIDQDAASITSGSWSAESLPALPSGVTSDDHLAVTSTPDGRVLAVAKTTDATTSGHPLIYLLARSTGGTWTAHTIENGPDEGGVRYTRPVLAVVGTDVVVMYGSIETPKNLTIRTAPLSSLSSWSTRTALFDGPDWSDSAVLPDSADIRRTGTTFPVVAQQRSDSTVAVGWQDAPPPVREGASTTGATVAVVGAGGRNATGSGDVGATVQTVGAGVKTGAGQSAPSVDVAMAGAGSKHTTGSAPTTVAIAATGQGHRVHSAHGASTAGVEVAAAGQGAKTAAGESTASVVATVAGAGTKLSTGASAPSAAVAAVGAGRRVESGQGSSTATIAVTPSGIGVKIARGGSVVAIATTATGTGRRVEAGTGASTTTVGVGTVGVGYARRLGSAITTVHVTTPGTGHNPAGPDDVELVVVRGPYGTTFTVGSPYGTTLTITGPRR